MQIHGCIQIFAICKNPLSNIFLRFHIILIYTAISSMHVYSQFWEGGGDRGWAFFPFLSLSVCVWGNNCIIRKNRIIIIVCGWKDIHPRCQSGTATKCRIFFIIMCFHIFRNWYNIGPPLLFISGCENIGQILDTATQWLAVDSEKNRNLFHVHSRIFVVFNNSERKHVWKENICPRCSIRLRRSVVLHRLALCL